MLSFWGEKNLPSESRILILIYKIKSQMASRSQALQGSF